MSYENPWLFNDKPLELEDAEGYEGFVYLIRNKETDEKYIGRKYFHTIRKVKGKTRRVRKESDWKTYYSSHDDLKKDAKENGVDKYERIVLHICKTRGDVNYMEIKEQFNRNVLEDDTYLNDNINGKWYSKSQHIFEERISYDEPT